MFAELEEDGRAAMQAGLASTSSPTGAPQAAELHSSAVDDMMDDAVTDSLILDE